MTINRKINNSINIWEIILKIMKIQSNVIFFNKDDLFWLILDSNF